MPPAAPAGSAPTPAPLCGTEPPQEPRTILQQGVPFSLLGRGRARGSGSWRDPPFSPPASGLLSSASSRCQEAAGRPPHIPELCVPGTAPLRGPLRWPHPRGWGRIPAAVCSSVGDGHGAATCEPGAGLLPRPSGVSGALCWWGWGWSGARLCRRLLTHSAAEHPWKATALLPPPPARCGLAGAPWEQG